MLGWFHENHTIIYLFLSAALIVLLAIWFRTKERRFLRAPFVIAGLLIALILFDVFGPDSPGRQMRRKIKAMAGTVQLKSMEAITLHVSDSFEYEGLTKEAMTRLVQGFINNGDLNEIVVWDFEPPEVTPAAAAVPGKARIAFKAKPKGNAVPGEYFFRCVAQFVQEPDGQWRMKTFEIFTLPHGHLVRIPQIPLQ